jgi:signal transduction histidine kinase
VAKFSERLEREADLFTASIGHDLGNPVNAVAMSARRLLVSGNLSDTDRATVTRIERASERLTTMLGDLRDFTRTRLDGPLSLQREPCNVAELIQTAVSELELAYPDRHITVECRGNLTVSVDRKRVLRLLSNLVANAVQHGAQDGDIQVRAAGQANGVTIEIHNGGPAIDAARMKRLFDPLASDGERKEAHLGLGLYISRQIALAHGGDIAVQSSSDAGTRFIARLPDE